MSDMSEREVELRKYEARIGLWKTGILSAAVAIATAVINYQISLRQVELEEQKAKNANALETQRQENAYLAQFVVNAMDEDLEKRIRFADYFATLTLSQERRQRWVEYREGLRASLQEKQVKLAQLTNQLEGIKKGSSFSPGEIASLQAGIARLNQDLIPRATEYSAIFAAGTVVPTITGMNIDAAIRTVRQSGLVLKVDALVDDGSSAAGTILSQKPPGGARLPFGATVHATAKR